MQSDWEAEVNTISNFSSQQDEKTSNVTAGTFQILTRLAVRAYVDIDEFSVHVLYVT